MFDVFFFSPFLGLLYIKTHECYMKPILFSNKLYLNLVFFFFKLNSTLYLES